MDNIGFTNVFEGMEPSVKPMFSKKTWFSNHVAGSTKFMENISVLFKFVQSRT